MSAIVTLVSLPVSALVIYALLHSPAARRLVAPPSADRWHKETTPLFGGIGIFLGILVGVGAAFATGEIHSKAKVLGIVGGCAVLFLAGLWDDVRSLPPWGKIAGQLAAVGIVLGAGLKVEVIHNNVFKIALAVFWLVGMTNAFNLLDNMDGLAATLAAIACGYFAIDAVTLHPNHDIFVLTLAVGLAACGFLPFNLRPTGKARTFMGDSGSQVLGFALASFGLASSWKIAGATAATMLLPILILAVPILDTTLVTITRLVEGRPVTQGGRDHTSHRLVYHGLSEKRAVLFLAAVAAALGGTSLAYNVLGDWRITLVGVLITFALLVQLAGFLADAGDAAAARQAAAQQSLWRAFVLQRRRLVEVLVDFALVTASFFASYQLLVVGEGTVYQRHIFTISLPALLAARYAVFIPFGLYRGLWRYAGARDAVAGTAAVVVSEALAYFFIWATQPWGNFPRVVFVIDVLVCSALVVTSRFAERALAGVVSGVKGKRHGRRTLIVGAGRGGRSLLRELRETPAEVVVGFVDDDPRLRRKRLQGVPVLGGSDELVAIIARTKPDSVLVTIPEESRERLDRLARDCADAGVPCRYVRREIVDLDPSVPLQTATE